MTVLPEQLGAEISSSWAPIGMKASKKLVSSRSKGMASIAEVKIAMGMVLGFSYSCLERVDGASKEVKGNFIIDTLDFPDSKP